ncbi:MAG TPA: WGR domain-containing protein [Propionibacteriaceae bacterium]|jgi:predicted DNA-binding WGR domain protein|nr:WGR domain-containing protein [Propionibacteriaceae bacterium]
MDEKRPPIQHVFVLRRIEPEQNVARFYALMIERDLFGRIVLVRHWGIGSRGRARADEHASQDEAATAMGKLAGTKRRRGYRDL